MMSAMPSWAATVVIAVLSSSATSLVIGTTFGPRIQARLVRVLGYHSDRAKFHDHIQTIYYCATVIPNAAPPQHATAAERRRLGREIVRWSAQLDEATEWIADNVPKFAFGYLGALGLSDIAARYAVFVRVLWLTSQPQAEKLRIMRDLTEHAFVVYVQRKSLVRRVNIKAELAEMTRIMDEREAVGPILGR